MAAHLSQYTIYLHVILGHLLHLLQEPIVILIELLLLLEELRLLDVEMDF